MEVKKYNTLTVKKQIIESIVKNSLTEREDGMKVIDYITFDLYLDMSLLSFYTDLNIDNVDMDELYKNGQMDIIRGQIPSDEVAYIRDHALNILEQEKEVVNSVSGVLARTLNNIVSKLPDEKSMKKIISDIPKMINKIDKGNLEAITSALGGKKG